MLVGMNGSLNNFGGDRRMFFWFYSFVMFIYEWGNSLLYGISPQGLGVYSVEGTPVPIPNTEVKLHYVDGTSWLHVGE